MSLQIYTIFAIYSTRKWTDSNMNSLLIYYIRKKCKIRITNCGIRNFCKICLKEDTINNQSQISKYQNYILENSLYFTVLLATETNFLNFKTKN